MRAPREHSEAGGLISYGSSLPASYRQVARLVDKILKGAKPGELPVEQADKFELVVNNKTAKALGLTIPESFLLLADEVARVSAPGKAGDLAGGSPAQVGPSEPPGSEG